MCLSTTKLIIFSKCSRRVRCHRTLHSAQCLLPLLPQLSFNNFPCLVPLSWYRHLTRRRPLKLLMSRVRCTHRHFKPTRQHLTLCRITSRPTCHLLILQPLIWWPLPWERKWCHALLAIKQWLLRNRFFLRPLYLLSQVWGSSSFNTLSHTCILRICNLTLKTLRTMRPERIFLRRISTHNNSASNYGLIVISFRDFISLLFCAWPGFHPCFSWPATMGLHFLLFPPFHS